MVRFGLFGGVRLVRDGVSVDVTQPKQRAMLALLLATPGALVAVSEMIDLLWAGEPAASVLNQVHRHIGALRRLCEPDLARRHPGRYIASVGPAYRIAVDPDTSDVATFRALTHEAAQAAQAGDRRGALRCSLRALQGAAAPAGDDLVRDLPVFVGLEDERVRAIVAAAELCETPDDHAALLPILRAATGRHRLDETLHAHEIIALRRTGRPGDALAVYRTVRDRLVHDLGASPGPVLEAAHAPGLRDPALGPVRGADPVSVASPLLPPAQLPGPLPGFAGRRAALDALRRQPRGLLLVTGMAGVGKTSLALRHAADVAADHPDGQLYVNLRGFDAGTSPIDPRDAVADLLHGLGVAAHSIPDSLGARSGLLRSLLADRRMLLVLDNARDYRQVEPLLPGTASTEVIVTCRSSLPGLVAFHQARSVELDTFGDDEVVEFFAHRLSATRVGDHRDAVIGLGQACGGLPLALAIVAARAQADPRFPLEPFVTELTAADAARLPALNAGSAELDLRTVFSWSHRGLSAAAARLFAELSAHPGAEISTAAAASMSGTDIGRTRAVLAELIRANVLRTTGRDRHTFHDLVREYAAELLDDGFAAVSRRLINHYVQSSSNAILSFHQPSAAASGGGADRLPGVVPETFTSSAQATAWYVEHRYVLHAVCKRAVDLQDHRSALVLMLDWRPMSQAVDVRHDMLGFAALAIDAAGHVDDLALQAEAYRDAASNYARTEQLTVARTYFDKAAAAYRESGQRLGLANLHRSMAVTLPMDPAERIELLQRSAAVVRELGDRPTLALALHSLGLSYLWAKRYGNALTAFDQALTLTDDTAGNQLRPHLLSARSRALAKTGRLEEAARDADQAWTVLRHDGAAEGELRLLRSHGDVLTRLGRRAEAAEAWRRYLQLAAGPERVRETNVADDDTDGATTIERIRAQLAALA